MFSNRVLERVAGVLFLLVLISLILIFALSIDVDTRRGEFGDSLRDIADNEGRYLTSLAFDFVSNLLTVALAAVFYLVFRPHGRHLALLGAFAFVAAGVTFMVSNAASLALNSLAEDFVAASGSQAETLESTARAVALTGEFALFGGTTLFSLALLALGSLIIWSRACPRELGMLAVASAVLILFVWLIYVSNAFWVVAIIGFIGTMLLQLLLGGWLLLRGTREPKTVQPEPAQA